MLFAAIDNGLDGALCAVSERGEIFAALAMPTIKDGKKRRVDSREVVRVLKCWRDQWGSMTVTLERPVGGKEVNAVRSMAESFSALRCCVELLALPLDTITPQSWQKDYWKRGSVEDTKAEALRHAKRLWPSYDLRKNPRCKIAHDGIVDALLIAEWARRQHQLLNTHGTEL